MDTTLKLSDIAQKIQCDAVLIRKPVAKRYDDWKQTAFEWRVTLRYQGRAMELPYFCGSAHGTKPPAAADVLSSLLLDASACSETFSDWCSEYGYDTDSRKTLEMFLECQRLGTELRRLLGADFAVFAEAENDA